MAKDEGEVSKVRQEIIDNANKSMALKERERRIDAKRKLLRKEYNTVKESRRHPVEQVSDGNIRVTIYIPLFLRTIIIVGWLVWFGVLPTIVILFSPNPGNVIYVPVILLISLVGLFLSVLGWFLYWWLLAAWFVLGAVIVFMVIYTGVVETNNIRQAVQALFGG
jgi:hypothetical protein